MSVDDIPAEHLDAHAAMQKHLSQPTGAGVFGGQHCKSAISSVMANDVMAADDISSAIARIEASEGIPAMAGRETGANARPAIIRIASSRRMAG